MKQLRSTLFLLAILTNAVTVTNDYWVVFWAVMLACSILSAIDDAILEVELVELSCVSS